MKDLVNILRGVLATPFMLTGILFIWIGELIGGQPCL